MKEILLGLFILAFQISFSQNSRNVGDFNSLKVYDKITVEIVHSDENRVEISDRADEIQVVNKNGELKIKMSPTNFMSGDNVNVTVFYKSLDDIQASQGSTISSNEVIESKMLSLTSNEGSKINLEINAERLNVKANSGGILNISGKANSQDIVVNSAGKFYGKEIDSEVATVSANAGGTAELNTTQSISATLRAGGVITVYGNPSERKVQKVFGGKIDFL
jgi:hypothetical protein